MPCEGDGGVTPIRQKLTPLFTAAGGVAESGKGIQDVSQCVNQQSEIKSGHVVFSSVMSALSGAT
jgi:hypothetical protein